SPAVEAVLSGFMLVAVLNFSTHFLALRARSLRAYLHDIETRSVLGLILASALGIAAYLHMSGQYASIGESLRHAVFNPVSLSTSTGYVSQDYASWPVFGPVWMLFPACSGWAAGSAGGGSKLVRALVVVKQSRRVLNRLV